jgi:uncharacterized oxidoreductase
MSFLSGNKKCTILITGVGSGIGLALAKNLISLGHKVIGVERDQGKIQSCKSHVTDCWVYDIGQESDRVNLVERIKLQCSDINVLINNAGVNNFVPLLKDTTESDWALHKEELNVNLVAPIHLSILLLPHLVSKDNGLIINVTDVLAFVPAARFPTYCATKAALHSFTLSLRHQLRETSVKVIELVPPMCDTQMLPADQKGQSVCDPNEYAKHAIDQVLKDVPEIGFRGSEKIIRGSRDDLDAQFQQWNGNQQSGGDGKQQDQKQSGKGEYGMKAESGGGLQGDGQKMMM